MKPEKEEAQECDLPSLETKVDSSDVDIPTDESEQENFDWETDPSVILHDQAATAAYFNSVGELVIRQRDTLGYEGTIYVAPENIEKFVEGLKQRALPQAPKRLRVIDGGGE